MLLGMSRGIHHSLRTRAWRTPDTACDALVVSVFGPISDNELSKRLAISTKTWRSICLGERRPRLHVVERIAASLGVDIATVLDAIEITFRKAREKHGAARVGGST